MSLEERKKKKEPLYIYISKVFSFFNELSQVDVLILIIKRKDFFSVDILKQSCKDKVWLGSMAYQLFPGHLMLNSVISRNNRKVDVELWVVREPKRLT